MSARIPMSFFVLTTAMSLTLSASAQNNSLPQHHVSRLLNAGLAVDSGATPVFLNGQSAAGGATSGGSTEPLTDLQVLRLLGSQVAHHRLAILVQQRGVDFDVTDDYLELVRTDGGDDEIIAALRSARVMKPLTATQTVGPTLNPTVAPAVDRAAEARKRALVDQHAARGMAFINRAQYPQAEQEYREAIKLLPDNSDLYASLANALVEQQKWNEAESAARESIRLNPRNPYAHADLGWALLNKGDVDGEIREEREAVRLDPGSPEPHVNLGMGYDLKRDWDADIAEQRAALNLNPDFAMAHQELGAAYSYKKDWDAVITEEREATRLTPRSAPAHAILGVALGSKGQWPAARDELRIATSLDPQNAKFRKYYDFAVQRTSH